MPALSLPVAFNFTPDELERNRQGRMSAAQVARFHKARGSLGGQLRLILLLSLIVAIVIPFGGDYTIVGRLCMFGFFTVTLTAGALITERWSRGVIRADTGVLSAEGTAHLFTGRTRFQSYKGVQLDRKCFYLTPEQYSALAENRRYRVYYPATLQMVLSVEELTG